MYDYGVWHCSALAGRRSGGGHEHVLERFACHGAGSCRVLTLVEKRGGPEGKHEAELRGRELSERIQIRVEVQSTQTTDLVRILRGRSYILKDQPYKELVGNHVTSCQQRVKGATAYSWDDDGCAGRQDVGGTAAGLIAHDIICNAMSPRCNRSRRFPGSPAS
jgi:hypothetical protein